MWSSTITILDFLISFSSLPWVILAIEVVCTLFSKLPSLFEMKATK